MRDIYVVTHTESRHHVQRRVGGWYDSGLTGRGQRQADAVATRLGALIATPAPRLVSSNLTRARETAARIATRFDVPLEQSGDLRELSYGVAEGKPQAWLDERLVPAPDHDRLDHRGIEGGETKREFATRIYRAMDTLLEDRAPAQIVVTHGFALTFVVAAWIGMPIEAAGQLNLASTSGGITHLHEDDFWRNRQVRSLNETRHLEGI